MFGRLARRWRIGRRLRRRHEASVGPGILEWTDEELARRLGDGRLAWRIRWHDVREIAAYKQDLFGYDRIWLSLRRTGQPPEWVECQDEDLKWEALCFEQLPARFPGLMEHWWTVVAFPAFVTNYTMVWGERTLPDNADSLRRQKEVAAQLATRGKPETT